MIKVLNLYAGIGGNRKLWYGDIEITTVEINPEIATIYKEFYPTDKVIIDDAHEYLEKHYDEYDFIWSSPPCQTHSGIRRTGVHRGLYKAVYIDFKLWQEIVLLKYFAKGIWVVENVKPFYKPFIEPTFKLDRHYFWANFKVNTSVIFSKREIINLEKVTTSSTVFGFNLQKYKIKSSKSQILKNLVNPEIGLYLFEEGLKVKDKRFKQKQISLFDE